MKKLVFVAALTCGNSAIGQTIEESLTKCAAETDVETRLDCFDAITSTLASEPESSEVAPVINDSDMGNWQIETEVSAIDDSLGIFLTLASEEAVAGPYGQFGPILLTLRCMENTTAAMIYFNQHFMSDLGGGGQVEYRLDDTSAQNVQMRASSDYMFLGLWSGGQAIPWIKELLQADRLVLRASPMNQSPVTGQFDLAGLNNAIDQLRNECDW
jgi:type VI secretion system protein VasI